MQCSEESPDEIHKLISSSESDLESEKRTQRRSHSSSLLNKELGCFDEKTPEFLTKVPLHFYLFRMVSSLQTIFLFCRSTRSRVNKVVELLPAFVCIFLLVASAFLSVKDAVLQGQFCLMSSLLSGLRSILCHLQQFKCHLHSFLR